MHSVAKISDHIDVKFIFHYLGSCAINFLSPACECTLFIYDHCTDPAKMDFNEQKKAKDLFETFM